MGSCSLFPYNFEIYPAVAVQLFIFLGGKLLREGAVGLRVVFQGVGGGGNARRCPTAIYSRTYFAGNPTSRRQTVLRLLATLKNPTPVSIYPHPLWFLLLA